MFEVRGQYSFFNANAGENSALVCRHRNITILIFAP